MAAGVANLKKDYPNAKVNIDQTTQRPSSIDLGRPAISTNERDAGKLALDFLTRQGQSLFALPQPQAELKVISQQKDPQLVDRTVVRVQQYLENVPVFGSEIVLKVRTGPQAAVTSVTSNVAPIANINTVPRLDSVDAIQRAKESYASVLSELPESQRSVEKRITNVSATLVVFDPPRLKLRGPAALAWMVKVGSLRVFIDAQDGHLVYRYRDLPFALNRVVYDCSPQCVMVLTETSKLVPVVSSDATGLHAAAGDVHGFYHKRFGRDGFDDVGSGGGAAMEVHALVPNFPNAMYEPSTKQLLFGSGWAARDLLAHEFTHAVMMHRPQILYFSESGAVHEYFADLFAAIIDDSGATRWIIGEGVVGLPAPLKHLRDMRNPHGVGFDKSVSWNLTTNAGQPAHQDELVTPSDRICSSLGLLADNDCVHFNGGILAMAAVLATDGGSFRNVAIRGIGVSKFEQIAYGAMLGLSGFVPLTMAADAHSSSCTDLAQKKQFGITDADCREVDAAFKVVGLR